MKSPITVFCFHISICFDTLIWALTGVTRSFRLPL
jgi:hypothetical protein